MPWLTAARSLHLRPIGSPLWGLDALSGRLCELSAAHSSLPITVAMGLVLDAQLAGETTAWVTTTHSSFFAPDAAALGIDLRALVVVRTEHTHSLGRVADHLARSGAFGLIVVDLCSNSERNITLPMPLQSRLLGLAQKHRMALIVLSQKSTEQSSLSSLVSLRGQVQRRTLSHGRLAYDTLMIKDKQRAPGWSRSEDVDGPPGLR